MTCDSQLGKTGIGKLIKVQASPSVQICSIKTASSLPVRPVYSYCEATAHTVYKGDQHGVERPSNGRGDKGQEGLLRLTFLSTACRRNSTVISSVSAFEMSTGSSRSGSFRRPSSFLSRQELVVRRYLNVVIMSSFE